MAVDPRKYALEEKYKAEEKTPPDESTRMQRVEAEYEVQKKIYRAGTPHHILYRAAILALMDRGDY